MRRKSAVLVAGLVLAAGMGSAEVLLSFGVVSGTADVEGPTFWAAPDGELWVNTQSPTDANYGLDGSNQERHFFQSLELKEGEWYPVSLDYFVEAKIRDSSQESNGNLLLSLEYETDDGFETICTETVNVDTSGYDTYTAGCSGDITGDVSGFQYKIEAKNLDAQYKVQAYDVTRVEVNAQ